MDNIIAKAQELLSVFGLKILAAIVVFIIGRWVAKVLKNVSVKLMTRSKLDPILVNFLGHMTYGRRH